MTPRSLIILILLMAPGLALSDQSIPDQYPGSILYAKPVEFIPNVRTSTGATAPATYENSGHNNNYTFVITGAGVVVVNSGSYLLAEALHDEIMHVTDEPVVLVINENGQGHAMLGNGYWREQGIPVLAHADAIRNDRHAPLARKLAALRSAAGAIRHPRSRPSDEHGPSQALHA